MDIKILGMVKINIEQNLRMKIFEARNGNYERNAVVKNQRAKQREQRSLGDCQESLLYVFEDNEAVINMIIKGKKPYNETCFQNR